MPAPPRRYPQPRTAADATSGLQSGPLAPLRCNKHCSLRASRCDHQVRRSRATAPIVKWMLRAWRSSRKSAASRRFRTRPYRRVLLRRPPQDASYLGSGGANQLREIISVGNESRNERRARLLSAARAEVIGPGAVITMLMPRRVWVADEWNEWVVCGCAGVGGSDAQEGRVPYRTGFVW